MTGKIFTVQILRQVRLWDLGQSHHDVGRWDDHSEPNDNLLENQADQDHRSCQRDSKKAEQENHVPQKMLGEEEEWKNVISLRP